MSLIKNSITFFFSILVALCIGEVGLRILDVGYGNAPLIRSDIKHHEHPKNYEFLMHDPNGEYGGHLVNYDKNGYRASNKNTDIFVNDSKSSIIFLGDSFTEGNQVKYEETFVDIISSRLNIHTLNLGVSSYSPIIYLLQVKAEVKKLKSSLVVMQVYANDFVNDSTYSKSATIENNEVVSVDGGQNDLTIQILRKSYLVRFLRKSQLTLRMILNSRESLMSGELNDFEKTFLIEQSISAYQMKDVISRIRDIDNELTLQGKKLVVFLIPSKSLSKINACCEKDKVYLRFERELRIHDIDFLDVGWYFSDNKNQKDLFFDVDIHLTADGHSLLSEALLNEFEAKSILRIEDES